MEKVFNEQIVGILRENMNSCKFDPSLYEKGETYIIRRAPTTLKSIPEVEVSNEILTKEPSAPCSECMPTEESFDVMPSGSSNFDVEECSGYNSKSQVLFGKVLSSDITAATKTCPAISESCEAVTSLDVSRDCIRKEIEARNIRLGRCTLKEPEAPEKAVAEKDASIGDHDVSIKKKGLTCFAECGLFDAFNEDASNGQVLKQVIKEVIKEYDGDQSRKTCTCCRRSRGSVFWPFPDEPVLAILDKVLALLGYGSDVDADMEL